MEPFLTIGVPTYARAPRLARLLAALAEQRGDGVHVLVSDNASPDDTPAVLAAHPWVAWSRRDENVGAVENARWLVANAPGRYVWLFGDDDVPAPGAVAQVLALLRARQPRWLHLPHSWRHDDGTLIGESALPPALEEHDGSGALYRRYHHWLSFISAEVVEAPALRAAAAEPGIRGCFAPLAWFMLAGRDGPCLVGDRRYVVGAGETSWDDRRAEIITRDYVSLWQDALHHAVGREDFAWSLDQLYKGDLYLDCWQERPAEELADAVRDFPTSRQLRRFLWLVARERDRRDLLGALEDADARARAEALVAEGEQRFGEGAVGAAAAAFQEAVAALPTLVAGWNDLGVALHALGRAECAGAFATALWLGPDDPDAVANAAAAQHRG